MDEKEVQSSIQDKKDILAAIGKLQVTVGMLQEKTDHIEKYVNNDLKHYLNDINKRSLWGIGIMISIYVSSIMLFAVKVI